MLNQEGNTVKTTRRYCLVCRLLSKPKTQPAGQPGGKLEPALSVGMENGAAAVKSVAVPQKSKIESTQDPAVPFLYLPKRTQSTFSKAAIFIPMLTAPWFMQPQRGKQSKEPSTNKGGSQTRAHTRTMEYYSALKRTNSDKCG